MQRMTKTEQLTVRITAAQRLKLQQLANATGGDQSAIIRALVDGATMRRFQITAWAAVPGGMVEEVPR